MRTGTAILELRGPAQAEPGRSLAGIRLSEVTIPAPAPGAAPGAAPGTAARRGSDSQLPPNQQGQSLAHTHPCRPRRAAPHHATKRQATLCLGLLRHATPRHATPRRATRHESRGHPSDATQELTATPATAPILGTFGPGPRLDDKIIKIISIKLLNRKARSSS